MRGTDTGPMAEFKIKGKRMAATAVIVDSKGDVQYHVIPTGWTKIVIVFFAVVLTIVALLAIMAFISSQKIRQLEEIRDVNTRNDRR